MNKLMILWGTFIIYLVAHGIAIYALPKNFKDQFSSWGGAFAALGIVSLLGLMACLAFLSLCVALYGLFVKDFPQGSGARAWNIFLIGSPLVIWALVLPTASSSAVLVPLLVPVLMFGLWATGIYLAERRGISPPPPPFP